MKHPAAELGDALECYVLPGQAGDALDLAMTLDSYIKERIAEALAALQQPGEQK